VDEDHPTVQELVEAGYNVEQSIEAVEHSEKLEEAMDYLLSLGGEGGIFQTSTSEKHQYWEEREAEFVEESRQERAGYVFHLYGHCLPLTVNTLDYLLNLDGREESSWHQCQFWSQMSISIGRRAIVHTV